MRPGIEPGSASTPLLSLTRNSARYHTGHYVENESIERVIE